MQKEGWTDIAVSFGDLQTLIFALCALVPGAPILSHIKGVAVEFAVRNVQVVVARRKWTVSGSQREFSSESRQAGALAVSDALLTPPLEPPLKPPSQESPEVP